MESSKVWEYIQDSVLESSIENSPDKKAIIIGEIQKMLPHIPEAGNDISNFYHHLFGVDFDEKNTTNILRMYSYCIIKISWPSVIWYMERLEIDSSLSSRADIYRFINPNERFKWTPNQNLELYHFLVRQVEVKKIIWELETQQEVKAWISEIREEIQTQTPTMTTQEDDDTPPIPMPKPEYQRPNNQVTVEIETQIKEDLEDLNSKIKQKISDDFWINEDDIKKVFSRISRWRYEDSLQSNWLVYAELYIAKNKLNFNSYLKELGYWTDSEDKRRLFEKFSPWSFWLYSWTLEQNMLIFRSLVIENVFGENFQNLNNYSKQEKIDEMLRLIDPKKVTSAPYYFWSTTTMCSKTARVNLQRFWVDWWDILWWNAKRLTA